MGPKKKGAGAKGKGKKEEEEDFSTKTLYSLYLKYSLSLQTPISKALEMRFQEILKDELDLKEILINEKIGPKGAKALADALKDTK